MPEATVGVIGGSGLYEMEGLTDMHQVAIDTPFGKPSDTIVLGQLQGVSVAFLPRHGRGHHLMPTELPVQANIYALKSLGVERVISISAVGSLRKEIHPLDLVVPDQIIDQTRLRPNTFFGDGVVAHVAFANPFCANLSGLLANAAQSAGARVHRSGTYVVMEGPAFSTKAESNLYRSWGADVIGMTAMPEAKLAREAEMCYATIACATDYDCWHEKEESVSVEMVMKNLFQNVTTSKSILQTLIPQIHNTADCPCATALENAIITTSDRIPAKTKVRLALIIGKYVT